jgi:hypothetical protein
MAYRDMEREDPLFCLVLPELAWVEAVSSALERVGFPDFDVGTPLISPPWTGGDEGEGDSSNAQCSGKCSFRIVPSQCTPTLTYAVTTHPILPPQGGKGYQRGEDFRFLFTHGKPGRTFSFR